MREVAITAYGNEVIEDKVENKVEVKPALSPLMATLAQAQAAFRYGSDPGKVLREQELIPVFSHQHPTNYLVLTVFYQGDSITIGLPFTAPVATLKKQLYSMILGV